MAWARSVLLRYVLALFMAVLSTACVVCAFSLYAMTNNHEYTRHRRVFHAPIDPAYSGMVVSPEEFHFRSKACWPASDSDLELSERQWRSLLGIPVWIPAQSEEGFWIMSPTSENFVLPRAVMGVLLVWLGVLSGQRIGLRPFSAMNSATRTPRHRVTSASLVFGLAITALACGLLIAMAPLTWYLAYDREQQNLPPLHPLVPVYLSFIPSLFGQVASTALAAILAACAAAVFTRLSVANLVCVQCGYDLAEIPSDLCPECGTRCTRGGTFALLRAPRVRKGLLFAVVTCVAWAVAMFYVHQSHHGYGLGDIWRWLGLHPKGGWPG